MTPRLLLLLATAGPVLLGALSGCGLFKTNDEAQAVVAGRVTGMSAGDFFQQYGPFRRRNEGPDGTTEYLWVSAPGATPNAGFYGPDPLTCTLRLVVPKSGKISVVEALVDNPGRSSASRCVEIFKPK